MKKPKDKTVRVDVYANREIMRARLSSEHPHSMTILETKIERQSSAGRKDAANHLLEAIQETLAKHCIDHLVKLSDQDANPKLL